MIEKFTDHKFSPASLELIELCNDIIEEYRAQGFLLTLRQLYYQLVARSVVENTQRQYKRVGSILNDARLAGLVDWDAIEDRTRNVQTLTHWNSPAEVVAACADQYREDKWADQKYAVEVWIEKEALAGVIEPVCRRLDVAFLACRGYMSQSEQWRAAKRMQAAYEGGREPVVLHLGDHDPSGIDMTRDNSARLALMSHDPSLKVYRLALNMDQVEHYDPPPNPAKMTDSRAVDYVEKYGTSSWELDALEPKVLSDLIEDTVLALRDEDLWNDACMREDEGKRVLRIAADNLRE